MKKASPIGSSTVLPYLLRAGSIDLSVVLSRDLSTGNTWQITQEGNTRIATVELINWHPQKDAAVPGCSAGKTLVKVQALKPGISLVELAYGPTGAKDTGAVRRITLKITVIPST